MVPNDRQQAPTQACTSTLCNKPGSSCSALLDSVPLGTGITCTQVATELCLEPANEPVSTGISLPGRETSLAAPLPIQPNPARGGSQLPREGLGLEHPMSAALLEGAGPEA